MKKSDLESAIDNLEALRGIIARQDYNTSVEMNKKLINVLPLLENELARMNKDNFDITSPMYMEITQQDCDDKHVTMPEYINNCLMEFSENNLSIIDFGINYFENGRKIGFIKYNRR